MSDHDTNISIEKGVPLPRLTGARHRYPFSRLEVGESFFVPSVEKIASVQSAASLYAKTNKVKLTTRSVDGGIRVWRVS